MSRLKCNKKEREEQMIVKVIRQLKKQIANIEKRRQKKEEKIRLMGVYHEEPAHLPVEQTEKEPLIEDYEDNYFIKN